jgi:hypothetical protein
MESIAELINKYGFPIVAAGGMGYFIYYVWTWVTTEIKPVIGLNQKVETVMELRGKSIEYERIKAEQEINRVVDQKKEEPPIGKRKATPQEIKDAAGDD